MNRRHAFRAHVCENSMRVEPFDTVYGPILLKARNVEAPPGPPLNIIIIGSDSGLLSESMKI